MVITEGESCEQLPYEGGCTFFYSLILFSVLIITPYILIFLEVNSCHDNCGKISNGIGCSCDWKCQDMNNCCPDIKERCPYSKFFSKIVVYEFKLC